MKNHIVRVWRDGRGHWLQITDTRTGEVVRESWAGGCAKAARLEARQIVDRIEWAERIASSLSEATP